MKMGSIVMIAVLLQLSLAGASQTVSFSGKDVSLRTVFESFKKQAGVFFFYDAVLLEEAKPVTLELKKVSLETALNETFKGQPLTWLLEDKTVSVVKRPAQKTTFPESAKPSSPGIGVKGMVTDTEGIPLPGVSVRLKGTDRGTISDHAGMFFLKAEQKAVLIFSSVNYINQEVNVQKEALNIKLQLDIRPMESLLVGGNLNAIKRKADATSITVLDATTLEKIPFNTIDQIFRGWVPGTNSFDVGAEPEGFPTLSIRGAAGPNSLSTIAVYIDGIEYAGGSGYLSQLDKNNIDRIEIVRGPGAATMYGTGSNGGIIQIFTKKAKAGHNSLNATTSAGFYKSKWVDNDPFQQMHNLESVTGFKTGWLKVGASYRTVGAYLPDGGEKNKGFYSSGGYKAGKLQANFTIRYNARDFHISRKPYYDTAINPRRDIFIEPVPGVKTPAYEWFAVRPTPSSYKDGITETFVSAINLSHRTSENWVNNLDAGYTGNTSREVPSQDGLNPLQRQYVSDESRITTIRYSNVLDIHNSEKDLAVIISSGLEYKKYSASRIFTRATSAATAIFKDPNNENYGAFVQLNPSYKNFYLTLGMRYENNDLFKAAWNPRLGITTNFDARGITLKPKISWGRGITSPTYAQRFGQPASLGTIVYSNPDIKPQSQQGFDYGVEGYDKNGKYKFEVVYYDNILKDVIGQDRLGRDPVDLNLQGFIYSNGSEIANRGWEFSGEYKPGRFSINATFSIINSFIKDTTGAYQIPSMRGKAPGTKMINLPAHTAGVNLNYLFKKLFGKSDKGHISLNMTGLEGVLYQDYRRYTLDVAYGRRAYTLGASGDEVENTVFRLGLYADYSITRFLTFFIQGANILNDYEYEFSSEYPTHGATWLFGFKYNYSKSNKSL